METLILHPSRVKNGFLLLISVLFTASGIWMIMSTGTWKGWFAAIFFGICMVVFVINLLPGKSYLKLTSEGFESASMSRKFFFKWTDIAEFGVTSVGFNKMVAFNFAAPYVKAKMGRSISRGIAGWEGSLHDTFGMKPEKLMNLMNVYLAASRKANQPTNLQD